MRIALLRSIVVAGAMATVAIVNTQARDPGLLQRGAVALSGTGVLAGMLTTDATPSVPVRRATIRLEGASGTSTRLVGSDDEGKFVFEALPAGSFTLSATKSGLVRAFYGSTRPDRGPGVPVAVAAGQRVDVAFKMAPGAVITGSITDSRGNPAPNVPVTIVGLSAQSTGAVPARGITDDRGVYRVFGLAPGEYLVSAVPRLAASAGGRGTASEIAGVTDAEVRWATGAGASNTASMPPAGGPVAYPPVFYPGTTDVSAATTVSVAVGEERAGIGLALQMAPTARISGTIVDAAGQTVTSATVALYPRRRDRVSAADTLMAAGIVALPRATVSATGFSIAGVAPGEYTVVARSGSGTRSVGPPAASTALWSVTDLIVDGRDQTDLVLRLAAGLKLSGTIAFEHTSLTPPADMSAMDLSLQASGSWLGVASTSRANVAANGTFTFSSVVPWTYMFSATPPGAGAGPRWTLKSAILNGRDLADSAFEVRSGGDVTGLAITFTDHAGAISGKLVDSAGRPVTRYSVVVFPTDRALWLANSRRVRAAPPATDGSFTLAGLPAGEYAIVGAEDVEATDLSDAAFLARLLASAYKVTLADGEQKHQDLRIGG